MRKVFIFFISALLLATSAHAYEFKTLKLKGDLKRLNEAQSRTTAEGLGISSSQIETQSLKNAISQKLLGIKSTSNEVSPLMEKIAQMLAGNYQQIGDEETGPLVLNHDIGGGVLNFSGFTWQKPEANFQLYVNRQLAPDLFSSNWIVHDTFLIGVDASTLLTNMRDEDMIDLSDEAIGAYSGLSFAREYKYSHFASTYLDGLQADYSKLFLAFSKFNPQHMMNMPPYEIMKKRDKFIFNAGGVAGVPLGPLTGKVGALVSVAHERKVTAQSVGPNDGPKEGEFLRLGVESSTNVSAGVEAELQADFFNILKIGLLSVELQYSYGKTSATHLSFFESDKEDIQKEGAAKREFKSFIQGQRDEPLIFRDRIVSLEERINQNLDSKYTVLLYGSMKKKETEQVKVVKDGVEKVFFRHYAESVKFIQNLWSRIFGTVIYALFEWDSGVKNAAEASKKLSIEFEYMSELGEATVDGADKFSVTLSQSFEAAKTHRWWHGLYRRESIRHLRKMTNLEDKFAEMVGDRELKGPLGIHNKIEIQASGLEVFNALEDRQADALFDRVCERKRSCVSLLRRKFRDYAYKLRSYGVADMMKFKSFLGSFFKRTRNYQDLYGLFGRENIFLTGNFNATTDDGLPFTTYFKEGDFQGLGVIDSFMR